MDFEGMAMLDLAESERERVMERFDEVSSGFAVLDDFDTSGVLPLVSVLDLNNVLREDVAARAFSRDEILENAPEQVDGYFQVPAAID